MTDNETTVRTLRLSVGLVVVAAAGCVAWAGLHLAQPASPFHPLLVAGLIVAASSSRVMVVPRRQYKITLAGAAILIAVALLPAAWAIACAACGTTIAKVATARAPQRALKASFNAGKDTVAATAAAAAFHLAGAAPATTSGSLSAPWWAYAVGLVGAVAAYTVVDQFGAAVVVGLASRTPWRRVAARDAELQAAIRIADLALVSVTLALYLVDPLLLAVAPLAVLVSYLANRHRLYLREERRAWQQLAASTDALSTVGLDEVVHTAIRGAADLYPDVEIEVELRQGRRSRVVRGDHGGVSYDGEAEFAPAIAGPTIEVPLEAGPGADGQLGVLRLHFRVVARLTDREQHMLTTFAAGLSTAIRNTDAYAEVSRLAEQNAYDATHDALTDLPNRRRLNERAAELLDDPDRATVALMLLDLDFFKEVNDTLGHDSGDRLLVEVAERLRTAAGDALVTRLGGDEFAVLFSDLPSPGAATRRARAVLANLRRPMELGGVLVNLHTSAGLAVAGDGTDRGELLRRADVAMYQAKDSGRQVAVYAQARDSADLGRLALAGELPRAVEGREFTVGFQPIVDLASGQAVGAEALTRWEHPDLGDLPPATFLGLVERSGLLAPFTEAVLDRALAAAASWHAAGFELQVAVNVSPRSLADPSLPKTVLHALDTSGVDPRRLTLELTETTALGRLDVVGRGIAAMREAGVRIALDDFGTGHSSLSAVFQVPVDQLKIDRTFVAALEDSREATAVVCSTIELGRRLDLTLVAEGVENARQRQSLWELGCTSGQGSLFGWPPQSSEDLLARLRQGYDGVAGALAARLHDDATVVRLPRQAPATRSEAQLGQQA